jgi:pimeloyl-ACP methyl ester carboxylesterase
MLHSAAVAVQAYYPYRSEEARSEYLASYDRIAKDWPIHSECRVVPTSWGETFVRVSGPAGAPPLVLLPGISTSSLIWEANIAALSAQYRTYALDRNGDAGRSICTRRMASVNDMVTWLDELFTSLVAGNPINLVGLSYGGWLSARYALHFPNRLRSLVLIAPGATVLRTNPEFMLRGILLLMGRRSLARATVNWLLADVAREDPARVELSLDRFLLTLKCLQFPRPIGPTVLKDSELQALRMPSLYLVGEHEKIYSAAKAVERLKRVAPQIRAEIVPGAGHDITIAQAQLVNGRILEFLSQAN